MTAKQEGIEGAFADVDWDELKKVDFKKFLIPLVVGLLANWFAEDYKAQELGRIKVVLDGEKEKKQKLDAQVSSFKSYESLKESLDADELLIKTKLDTANHLMSDRVRSFDELFILAKAMPKSVWLTDLDLNETSIRLRGGSLEFSEISDLMKALNEKNTFSSVNLLNSSEMKAGSVDGAQFEVEIKKKPNEIK
ncbi:MAG: PilN domain-containing protein [Bdellovibrionia bacterium]